MAASPATNQMAPDPSFLTTQWSMVRLAAQVDAPDAPDALENLCQIYWYPLYVFVRRQGHTPHEAEDLTQEFFARLLERNSLAAASPGRGRFRSFLLGAMKHFLANEWRERQALKRGGGQFVCSIDSQQPEDRYRLELVDSATPEVLFERRWALTVLDRVMARLREEFAAAGKASQFEELKAFLSDKKPAAHADVAARLGVSASGVGVAVHRLRQRYGELVREEIARTVGSPEEVDDEVRHLIEAVGR